MREIKETFGSMVFNETVMQERLPKEVNKKLQKTIIEGKALDVEIAEAVANAMKDYPLPCQSARRRRDADWRDHRH